MLLAIACLVVVAAMVLGGWRWRAARLRIDELETQVRWYHGALRVAGVGVWQWDMTRNRWHWIEDVFHVEGSSMRYRVAIGETFFANVHPEDREWLRREERECLDGRKSLRSEYRYLLDDGQVRWLRDIGDVVAQAGDGRPRLMFGITIDVTREKEITLDYQRRSNLDELTGLPNRGRLMKQLEAMTQARESFGLGFIDLNGFKALNDEFGHASGDLCLSTLGGGFRRICRRDEFAARIGGDEFVVLVPVRTGDTDAACARILEIVEDALAGTREAAARHRLGAATGVAFSPQHGAEPNSLLGAADSAMYLAKSSGRRMAFAVHSPPADPRRQSA